MEPGLADRVERYMREKHVPEIWATGCFQRIRFDRAGPTTFRTSYEAASPAELARYLRDHATDFRADFAAHFPAGVSATRATWSPVEEWG